jgi:branched-chain amino acid transport system substrate-binding protein
MIAAAALALTGCGTRASDAEVRAGVPSAGTVTLDQATIDQLTAAAQAGGVAGSGTVTGLPAAAGTGAGTGTTTTPTVPTDGAKTGTGRSTAGPATSTASGSAPATSGRCTAPAAPVSFGQIGSFSGVLGAIFASARTTAAIYAQYANASGGLACHPVTVYSVDDGGDPSRAAALAQDLIGTKKVSALVATFAPLSMGGILPVVERNKTPMIGGDAVDPAWFSRPLLFPQGAGLDAMIEGSLRLTVSQGKTKLGLLYCVEASLCTSIAKTLPERAKAVGAEMVYQSPVSLTQTDFTAQCQNAKNAGVQSFGMGVDGSAIARVARSCAALGYFPQFASGGGVISPPQARDPGIRHNTMTTSSGTAPWFLTDTPGQQEYAGALARYSPGMEPDGNSMQAWASMKLVEAAVRNLGVAARAKPLLSGDLLDGLGKVKRETLDGLSPPFTFSPGQKAAPQLHCVYFELLTDKGWTAPNGSKPVCTNGT